MRLAPQGAPPNLLGEPRRRRWHRFGASDQGPLTITRAVWAWSPTEQALGGW
jgi:hypothetical protein